MKTAERLVPELRFPEFEGEWEKKKVGELCDYIVPGRNKPKEFGGDIPWITTPDLVHHGYVFRSKKQLKISKGEAKKVGSKIVPPKSIIISCVGELGLVSISGQSIVINQQLHAFLPKENILYNYLLYILSCRKKYMYTVATKTALPYMNKDNCNSIPINLPSLPEQQKIASFLSAVDKKIEKLTRKKELLQTWKKGLMQKIFSRQIRFKDDDGKNFPDWEEKRLGEVASFSKGKGLAKVDVINDGNIKCIRYGELYTTYNEVISQVYSATNINVFDLVLSKSNDILIPSSGETHIDLATASCLKKEGIAIGGDVNIIRTKNNGVFLAYYLNNKLKNKIASLAQGSSVIHLYAPHLKQLAMLLPSLPEQQKIASFLSNIDKKIEAVDKQLTQIQTFKKGLLQKMFV